MTTEAGESGIGNGPLIASLIPFALLLGLYFLFPEYGNAAFASPPDIIGVPLGMIPLAIAIGWGALGVYLTSEADSLGRAAAVLVTCTLPSSIGVLAAPVLVTTLRAAN